MHGLRPHEFPALVLKPLWRGPVPPRALCLRPRRRWIVSPGRPRRAPEAALLAPLGLALSPHTAAPRPLGRWTRRFGTVTAVAAGAPRGRHAPSEATGSPDPQYSRSCKHWRPGCQRQTGCSGRQAPRRCGELCTRCGHLWARPRAARRATREALGRNGDGHPARIQIGLPCVCCLVAVCGYDRKAKFHKNKTRLKGHKPTKKASERNREGNKHQEKTIRAHTNCLETSNIQMQSMSLCSSAEHPKEKRPSPRVFGSAA